MGRLGPLTSQGLGRSPYDDVVQGEGEADPREPPQQYDERGRPVNPLTRQMNKDIIRSHNEVMQVIGVAEPDNVMSEPQKLTASHKAYENDIGIWLLSVGRFVSASGVWGVAGIRHRILLYKQYSHIPLLELWNHERQQRSLSAMLLAGYPASAAVAGMIYGRMHSPVITQIYSNPYTRMTYQVLEGWIQLHLNMFALLQQLGILSARSWLPHPTFFIPCSSTSLIPAPPPPTAYTVTEAVSWLGRLALNAAPLLGVYASQRMFTKLRPHLRQYFCSLLPRPTLAHLPAVRDAATAQDPRPSPPASQALQSMTPPQSPAPAVEGSPEVQPELNAGGFPTTSQMRPRDEPRGHPEPIDLHPIGGTPAPTDPQTPGRVRRQSTISTRGVTGGFVGVDSYGSDDEDNNGDMVSTTLISFDVEATDATDPPPGQWSAELRPNVAEGSRSDAVAQSRHARPPTYRSTALTRLPSTLAADIFSWLTTWILSAPVEAVASGWFVRSFAAARGLGVDELLPFWSFGLTRHTLANFAGITLVNFFVQFDIWASMYGVASLFFFTEDEWSYMESEMD